MSTGEYPYDELEALERAVLESILASYTPAGSERRGPREARTKIEKAARELTAALDLYRQDL